jgi:CRISPR system Cascade subunit CasC
MAAAFETPVRADHSGGFSGPSRTALAHYARDINRLTSNRNRPFHGHAGRVEDTLQGLGDLHESFDSLISTAVDTALPETGTPA